MAWTNYIEISNAVPADGGSNDDIDGTFDTNLKNDFQYSNLANNNVISGLGGTVNEDEDNHDMEIIQVFDLALRKTITTPPPYSYGQDLTFKIAIYNQGNVVAKNIRVKDFVPEGYQMVAGVNTPLGWNMADTTNLITSFLFPGDSVILNIILKVQTANSRKDWFNYAHIINAQDTVNNNRFDDADSFPAPNNAAELSIEPGHPGDDDIFVLGPPNVNRDEDDHDPAGFEVSIYP